jgi:hypothetical protein
MDAGDASIDARPDGDASFSDAAVADGLSPDAEAASADGSTAALPGEAGFVAAIGLPLYVDPSDPAWAQARMAAPTVALLIANPNSGPGNAAQSSYTQAIASSHAVGQTIVGYVHTTYGARPIAQVQADIDSWYAFYPAIDGIFSDETSTDATLVVPYYMPLYEYVKGKSGQRIVVVNPGTATSEAYMQASDIVMSFEDTYANYVIAAPAPWVTKYSRARFWNIVLSASQMQMQNAVSLARQRNAGLMYVTDQGPATAYQKFVTGAYWQSELEAANTP